LYCSNSLPKKLKIPPAHFSKTTTRIIPIGGKIMVAAVKHQPVTKGIWHFRLNELTRRK
jgi:hypothetical protein